MQRMRLGCFFAACAYEPMGLAFIAIYAFCRVGQVCLWQVFGIF
jgi:hypothetical protein